MVKIIYLKLSIGIGASFGEPFQKWLGGFTIARSLLQKSTEPTTQKNPQKNKLMAPTTVNLFWSFELWMYQVCP